MTRVLLTHQLALAVVVFHNSTLISSSSKTLQFSTLVVEFFYMNNSDLNHDYKTVFYDFEIKKLNDLIKESKDILTRISKRCEYRQNVQISESLFSYSEKVRIMDTCPEKFFSFCFDDVKICIIRYNKKYSVSVCGFTYDKIACFRCQSRIDYTSLFGCYDSLVEAYPLFFEIVSFYLFSVRHVDELQL